MSHLGVELLALHPSIETIQVNDVVSNVTFLTPIIKKNTSVKCIARETITLLPNEDSRKWTLFFTQKMTDEEQEKCFQLVYVEHNNLTIENGGALLYIPFSHGMQEEPTLKKLLNRKFRSKKDHKIYDMKKAHLLLQPKQMLLFDKFSWRSLDKNKTEEPISLTVVSLQLTK